MSLHHSNRQDEAGPARGGKRFGFEFKYADSPKVTKSMTVAQEDLKLARLFVIPPGDQSYDLNDWARALSIDDVRAEVERTARSA